MAKKILMPNPWLTITPIPHVAQCDEQYFIRKYGSVSDYERRVNTTYPASVLTFSCLPEPFSGNPNSMVFCLNKNPGKPDSCFVGESAFEAATINNLRLLSPNCFWAEKFPNKCGKLHDGVQWLAMRTNTLKKMLGRHPNIFFIEYFPYHSTQGFPFPEGLPSYEFSNMLIEQAILQNKLIIIMREKTNWLTRIPGLLSYGNLVYLKCSRGGYLTPQNLIWAKTGKNFTDKDILTYF